MKTSLLFVMTAVAVVGCTGPNGGEENYDLDDGSYEFSNTAVLADDCGFGYSPSDFNGYYVDVTVLGSDVIMDEIQLDRSGNSLTASYTEVYDYAPDLDCKLAVTDSFSGEVQSDNEFTLSWTTQATEHSGSECFVFDPLPCTTRVSTRLSRL